MTVAARIGGGPRLAILSAGRPAAAPAGGFVQAGFRRDRSGRCGPGGVGGPAACGAGRARRRGVLVGRVWVRCGCGRCVSAAVVSVQRVSRLSTLLITNTTAAPGRAPRRSPRTAASAAPRARTGQHRPGRYRAETTSTGAVSTAERKHRKFLRSTFVGTQVRRTIALTNSTLRGELKVSVRGR